MKLLWVGAAAAVIVACGSDEASSSSSSGASSGASSTSSSTSSSSTSSSSGENCPDCGECGISGIVGETSMRGRTYGVDATGRAAVTLNLAKEGECEGENQHASTLHVAPSNDAFEITPGFEMLDRTKAKPDTSQGGVTAYVWNDRDLSVKVDNEGAAGLTLTFSSASATLFRVKCLPVGETGSCTKE